MTGEYLRRGKLRVHRVVQRFIEDELLPAIGMEAAAFWSGLGQIVHDLTADNRELLRRRKEFQGMLDAWHEEHGLSWDPHEYMAFLREIGYLAEPGEPFQIDTAAVDAEIATIAGPQLVVPVDNARFAVNAANARWGSLYDALYGSDVISEEDGCERGGAYNSRRGAAVIRYAADFLDRALPLARGTHADVVAFDLDTSGSVAMVRVVLADGSSTMLADPEKFVAYRREGTQTGLLFRNNGLHIELQIDPDHPVGRDARANVSDVLLEAAITTIQDCEDSVAAVDADDKVAVYRNWLRLVLGTLEASFEKNGRKIRRQLAPDRHYVSVDGAEMTLPGRSLMLVRNVGHLMTTDAVRDASGEEIFEGLLDAVVTCACALADRRLMHRLPNSRDGSVYIVKPKMHGPAEVAFTNTLFNRVEDLLGLDRYTLKVGVMDEERRTTVNLAECIREVRHRIVFINTGFLDRTGDEIHSCMRAGPVLPKEAVKSQPWIRAYEDRNVDTGIRCGLPGRAQIGKGMWPKPDAMREMVATKHAHPEAGASCAWVPSPTGATLHAMHYHVVDVRQRQRELANREPASLASILTPPLIDASRLDANTVQAELDNNVQGILGYVVRWIDAGIGCSKVPDIHDVGLMEDRATLRISSQHIANWLLHGICTEQQVRTTLERMAAVVDRQNVADPDYAAMAPDFEKSLAFKAACRLIFEGAKSPNGYTEPILHAFRRQQKSAASAADVRAAAG